MYASGRSANEGRLLQAASWPWSNKQRRCWRRLAASLVVDSGIASLLGSIDAGDVVVVASLGGSGSTSASAVRAALEIGAKAAELVVLDQCIDTSKEEHGAFFRHAAAIMGVDEGRKGPRAKPGHTGGKSKVDPSALANAIGMYQSGEHKLSEITAATGISRSTLYRNLPKGGDGDG